MRCRQDWVAVVRCSTAVYDFDFRRSVKQVFSRIKGVRVQFINEIVAFSLSFCLGFA